MKKTFTLERIELADEHARPHRTRERASDEGERRSSQRNRGYKERLEREPSADASEVGYALPQGKRSSDPLFDQPYQEPENTTEQAAWDVSLPALSSQKNFLSRYIKPKRKQVAALLGGNESNK